MKKKYLTTLILAASLSFIYPQIAAALDDLPDEKAPSELSDKDGTHIIERAGIMAEAGVYAPNKASHTLIHRRGLDIEILQSGRFSIFFLLNEETLYSKENGDWNTPYRIQNIMDYVHLRWKFAYGYLGFVFDHICYNIIDQKNTDMYELRWYGAGLKWESPGMRMGQKNQGIQPGGNGFEFLNRFNYMLYAGKSIVTERFKYDAIAKGVLRYDIFRFYNIIPYAEGMLICLIDSRARLDRSIEAGARINLADVSISPYAKYLYQYDIDLYNGLAAGFWIYGLRLEALLGDENVLPKDRPEQSSLELFKMHFSAGYGKYFFSNELGFRSDFALSIDVIEIGGLALFYDNRLVHSSKKAGSALFPRFLTYTNQAGFSYYIGMIKNLIEIYYENLQRHEGNDFKGFPEKYHLIGLRIKSPDMKIGRSNTRISFGENKSANMINNLSFEFSGGKIIQETHYEYTWDYKGAVRWDILRYGILVPYLSPDAQLYKGQNYDWEYGAEAGVRLKYGLDIILYTRYDHIINIDRIGGASEDFQVLGFRVEK